MRTYSDFDTYIYYAIDSIRKIMIIIILVIVYNITSVTTIKTHLLIYYHDYIDMYSCPEFIIIYRIGHWVIGSTVSRVARCVVGMG